MFYGEIRAAHFFHYIVRVFFCFLFIFVLCLECPILPVSLDYPFLNIPSVFSNVYKTCINIGRYGCRVSFESFVCVCQFLSMKNVCSATVTHESIDCCG